MMDAAALVVGIDGYDHAPRLTGCVQNAVDAVDWLMGLGVPPERIRLNADPQPTGLDPKIQAGPATRQGIKDALFSLASERGEHLFVFFSGHGLYVPAEGAVLLTREFQDPNALDANFGVSALVDYLLSLPFRRQLLVCDACQNPSNLATQRPRIEPNGVGVGAVTPDLANNGLLLGQATTEGQFAYLIGGRTLLTPNLLDTLKAVAAGKPPRGAEDAVIHDWATGERTLDLRPVFGLVGQVVEDAAKGQGPQTPILQPHGRFRSADQYPLHPLDGGEPQDVTVEVRGGGLDEVKLELRPPVRELVLPGAATPFPHVAKAPLGARLRATCWAEPGWSADPPTADAVVPAGGLSLEFRLSPPPPRPAPPPADVSQFNVRIIGRDGRSVPTLDGADYDAMVNLPGMTPPSGTSFQHNEVGPDIGVAPGDAARAGRLARNWRDAISDRLERRPGGFGRRDLEVVVIPPGVSAHEGRPNLRIAFASDPRRLAGRLVDTAILRLARLGDPTGGDTVQRTLGDLAAEPWARLAPGVWRAELALPWGRWSATVEVTRDGPAELMLPETVGRPPLRNDRNLVLGAPGGRLRVGGGYMAFVEEVVGEGGLRLHRWRVGERRFSAPVAIGSRRFPLRGRVEDGALRVEPWSTIGWPEWDLIFTAARLDDVDLAAALARLDALDRRDVASLLLPLGLAYAAYVQNERPALQRLVRRLETSPLKAAADVRLLRRALGQDAKAPLRGGPDIPLLRWGFALHARFEPDSPTPPSPHPLSSWTVIEG